MSDYKELLQLFTQLEPLQKETEQVAKGLDAAALNETRNAAYHLLIALCDEKVCAEEIKKAENHTKRAIYDCHEAILLTELDRFKVFKEEYRNVVVTNVIPDYINKCQQAESAKDKIMEVRNQDVQYANDYDKKYAPDRNKMYADIAPYLKIIQENNKYFDQARPELNKIITKENDSRRSARNAKIGTLIAVVVAVAAWLFPRTPT
jgi:hypothetical protein